MARITNRRLGELIQKLFLILQKYPDGLRARDALSMLADTVTLTEYESGSYDSGRRFEKIVRFATVDTVRAGWLIKDSGMWTVTEAGIKALKAFKGPLEFHREASRLYRQWHKNHKSLDSKTQSIDPDIEVEDESDKSTSVLYEEANEQAKANIDAFLHEMDEYVFQQLVADLLKAMGYHIAWIAKPGKDGGVDIIAYTDPLGTKEPRIKVQVKQQQKTVSMPELKSFMSNIGQYDVGIFVCTGGFTRDASDHARNYENKKIMLINSDKLVELWIENIPKLNDQAWQKLPLTPIYFLTPQD